MAHSPETVVVGYLSGGETTLAFTRSLNDLTAYMITHAAADPQFPRLIGALPKQSGPRIAEGRNNLVRHFLSLNADWLFMLDDDMTFAPDSLDRLLRSAHPDERPIVGGLCFGGGRDGWFPTLYQMHPDLGSLVRFDSWDDGLLPVDATGGACILIHRSVFEELAGSYEAPWEWFQETRLGDKSTGEDITFCLRARAAGFPIFVNTTVEFGHMKLVEIDRKYYEDWNRNHRFVITGTGRSGTRYMAAVLSTLGVPCYHERVHGPLKEPEWGMLRGDSSWMAAPYLDGFGGYVLHVVRHPLDVVSSMLGIGFFDDDQADTHGPYREFAQRWAPDVFAAQDPTVRAMRWWIEWNTSIEHAADARIRVEDFEPRELVPLVRAAGGFHSELDVAAAMEKVPQDLNHRTRTELEWDDLPDDDGVKERVAAMAKRYGYDPKRSGPD